MKPMICGILIVAALCGQNLKAAQALAVASNGKWAMAVDINSTDLTPVSAKAIADCKAKGGVDPKIVWSQWSNVRGYNWRGIHHGAVAVSDNGTGAIVAWSFDQPRNVKTARDECRRKGGQHPKIVGKF
jgi:hypothetical protein